MKTSAFIITTAMILAAFSCSNRANKNENAPAVESNDAEWVTTAEGNKMCVVDMDETFGLFTKGGLFDKYYLEDSIPFPRFIVRSNFELPDDIKCVRITFNCYFSWTENMNLFTMVMTPRFATTFYYKDGTNESRPKLGYLDYYNYLFTKDDKFKIKFKVAEKVEQYAEKLIRIDKKTKEVGEYYKFLLRKTYSESRIPTHMGNWPVACYIYNPDIIRDRKMSLEYQYPELQF